MREALHTLAKELFDRKRLTGDEVASLVTIERDPSREAFPGVSFGVVPWAQLRRREPDRVFYSEDGTSIELFVVGK